MTGLRIAYPGADGEQIVVDSVSLAIGRGEVLGLVGESGCGKTQVVLAVLGLLPDGGRLAAGQVRFAGQRIDALRAAGLNQVRGRRIGYVSQEPMSNLDPSFTIGSQLIEPIRVHLGLRRSQARDRAAGLLARVGIADPDGMLASYPHQISGGMAQRALIAGAISCDPDLLIADEPTTALDVTVQAEVLDLLWSLQRERSMAVLIVSHDLGVVADLCDRVAVMYAGEIVEQAEVGALFARPAHPYTRGLIAAGARRSGWREPLAAIPGAVPARIDPAGGCRFAPRCSYATAACAVHPPLRPLGRDLVRCVNADQWAQR